jgi:sulfatase modifying factor 1
MKTFRINNISKLRRLGLMVGLLALLHPASQAQTSRFFRIAGPVQTTITAFNPGGFVTWTNVPTNATFVVQITFSLGNDADWQDYLQFPAPNPTTTLQLVAPTPPENMDLIPAGSFTMGNTFAEGEPHELPLHTVYVSALYMDRFEVWKSLWDDVYLWAITNGYSFDNPGSWYNGQNYSHGPSHPVQTINWYDAVKWCNARSEKEGLLPAYYTNAAQTAIYRTGNVIIENEWVKWSAGYRLPTEAEWEKAARAGASGQRFPWGNTIAHSQANYWSSASYGYDISVTRGYHPLFQGQGLPYTNPVGLFDHNTYGIYGTAGNVYEWCWDQYNGGYASALPVSDPRGPTDSVGSHSRVVRGGMFYNGAYAARNSHRNYSAAGVISSYTGFRCVRGL